MSAQDPNDRLQYAGRELDPATVEPDPLRQLARWIEDGGGEPRMVLATVDAAGRPDARVVLVRGELERGLRFYTNYDSEKAAQLAANPRAAAVLYWAPIYRQARVRGRVERLGAADSDAYWASRPRGSQLGAWASPQSRSIAGRELLDAALAEAEARFAGADVPRPAHWGGYELVPDEVELWSGRPNRLHDRVRYTRDGGSGWRIERLAP